MIKTLSQIQKIRRDSYRQRAFQPSLTLIAFGYFGLPIPSGSFSKNFNFLPLFQNILEGGFQRRVFFHRPLES